LIDEGFGDRPDDRLIVALDSPAYHRLECGKRNRFSGIVFDSRNRRIEGLRILLDGRPAGEFSANLPSEDVAAHFPGIASSRNCRFDFEVLVPEAARTLRIEALGEGGSQTLFELDLEWVKASGQELRRLGEAVDAVAAPPREIVFLTQGHRDSVSYRESIVPGLVNQKHYLRASGVDPEGVASVLDFGCGSGRLLVGWYAEGRDRGLYGCDVNSILIEWARRSLPADLHFERNSAHPPLPYPEGCFDLVDAVSVFTHLGWDAQHAWAREICRVIRPGGGLLLTTHGNPYVELFAPERRSEYESAGHFEIRTGAEGSNDFASFHTRAAIEELLPDFETAGVFPSGTIEGRRVPFPLAAFQDVYVLRKRAEGEKLSAGPPSGRSG
jgi:SAM-dependent methyltransferase